MVIVGSLFRIVFSSLVFMARVLFLGEVEIRCSCRVGRAVEGLISCVLGWAFFGVYFRRFF